MAATKLDTKFSKDIAEDLSLLNGLPNKINLEYIRNIQQLIMYRICEQRLIGRKTVSVEIPMLGMLTISTKDTVTSNINIKPSDLVYSFEPTKQFNQCVVQAFNNEGFDLPEMLASKYGDRILKVYNDLLY